MMKAQAPSPRSTLPGGDASRPPSATIIRLDRRRAAAKLVRRFDPARQPPRPTTDLATAASPVFRPRWLVAAVLTIVLAAHAAGLWALSHTWVEPAMSLDTIDLQVVAAGDSSVDAPATPPEPNAAAEPDKPDALVEPSKPEPLPLEPQPAEPLPVPVEAPPPPVVIAPEAPILPIAPPVEPIPPKPEPKPRPAPKPQPKPHPARPAMAAQKKGIETGKAVDAGATLAAYGALINAEANAHRFYPESARLKGLTGRVTVTFTIGRAGTATNVSISQSSGHSELDDAARQAIRAIHAAPPPGGSFTASKSFTYALH